MKWIRYDIKTKTDASDIITAELYDLGITSVEVTDNILPERETLGGYVVDIQPENYMSELGDDAIISFYLSEDDENKRELLEQVARKLEEVRCNNHFIFKFFIKISTPNDFTIRMNSSTYD